MSCVHLGGMRNHRKGRGLLGSGVRSCVHLGLGRSGDIIFEFLRVLKLSKEYRCKLFMLSQTMN